MGVPWKASRSAAQPPSDWRTFGKPFPLVVPMEAMGVMLLLVQRCKDER